MTQTMPDTFLCNFWHADKTASEKTAATRDPRPHREYHQQEIP